MSVVAAWPNTATIDGLDLDLDAPGDSRVVTKVAGWEDAPEVRSDMQNRSQQHGAWDSTGYFSKRTISVDGLVECDSIASAKAVGDALRALSPRRLLTFTVSNQDTGSRSAQVRVTQGAVLEWLSPAAFTYSLQLTAPDPLLYGPDVFLSTGLGGLAGTGRVWPRAWPRDWGVPAGSTAGSLVVPNAGTSEYWPRLRIDGPVPNPVVTVNETGDTLRYAGTLLAGQYLDIDCGNRRVLLNGQVSMAPRVTWSGSALAIPSGGASVSWNADAADPAATLSVFAYEGAWQ